jgi:hypothetical protein
MKEKDIKEILDTIDVLKYIAEKGREEVRQFSHYMIAFGFYIAFNVVLTLITEKYYLWFYTLPLAFFFSSIHIAGLIPAFLTWTIISLILWITVKFLPVTGFLIGVLMGLLAYGGYYFLYFYGIKKGKYKPYKAKIAVVPKIGLLWGFTMFGAIYIYFLGIKIIGHSNMGKITTTLFSYATGIGLFATGIILPFFYILGFIETFLVPVIYYLNPYIGYSLHGIVGFLMGVYGIYITKRG